MAQERVPDGRRIHEIDVVRGFALAGILVVNIEFFGDPGLLAAMTGGSGIGGGEHGPVQFVVQALFEFKFYVIFSFLFGYSFTLQMRSAERAGASVRARTLRRCLGLFAIGALHGLLLWVGDILTLYAALGLVLLAARNIGARAARISATVLISVMSLLFLLLAGLVALLPGTPTTGANSATAAESARILSATTGGPLDYLGMHLTQYPQVAAMIWLLQGPMAMALFLLGLAAGKARLFDEPDRWAHLITRVQWVGFGLGLPTGVFYAATSGRGDAAELVALALTLATSAPLAAAYVVTLLRLVRRFPPVAGALAPAGRMAASNYVGQSVLLCLVFTGYGLGLMGRIPPLGVMGVAVVVYAVLLALSAWWLRGHRYGPVEYGLRRLTNWG
ncbi:DUF418 domain-containing protein [Streptosporangium sp. NPDC002721]|uniref:DUF418 domain-containing protein n=1 Tax=Streptosporangium sp. NPDC002721 TaxID=3366188 RepID=UPI0036BB6C69